MQGREAEPGNALEKAEKEIRDNSSILTRRRTAEVRTEGGLGFGVRMRSVPPDFFTVLIKGEQGHQLRMSTGEGTGV